MIVSLDTPNLIQKGTISEGKAPSFRVRSLRSIVHRISAAAPAVSRGLAWVACSHSLVRGRVPESPSRISSNSPTAAESTTFNLYDVHRATFIGRPTAGSGPEAFQKGAEGEESTAGVLAAVE